MRIIFTIVLFLLPGIVIQAQHLAAYTDYRNCFYIFDRGKSTQVEDLDVQSFAIGGECVLFVNSQGNLKLYFQGAVYKLESGGVTEYYATDHLAAYTIFNRLCVVENGQSVTLSTRCPLYQVEDSLIVFYDENKAALRVYYNGNVEDIESGLMGLPLTHLASGDNIIAYISSRYRDFKIYYNGENRTMLRNVGNLAFRAGKDIVAYVSSLDNTFHVFYKGEDTQLEDFPPKSFRTGDSFVAYVDNTGIFKIFYKGHLVEISTYAPDGYYAEDNLVLFTEGPLFKIFYRGEVYEVEAYIPRNFKLDWNTVAYIDNTNRIWLFTNGEKKFLTNDFVNSFEIYRDLIVMNVKVDRNRIYYKGKFYEGTSY